MNLDTDVDRRLTVYVIFASVGRLRLYLDGLIHFLSANSRHGTHSPFVYQLVDEVIYPKRRPGEPNDREQRLIARLIKRFQPDTVYTADNGCPQNLPLDFLVVDCADFGKAAAQVEACWGQFHSGSVLVLSGFHLHEETKALWESIKAKADVTVTIDMFRLGLVFFHAGQAKEDFRIRY